MNSEWRFGIWPCRLGCLLLGLRAFAAAVSAHQLDEYLQATLVDIEPGSIRLQMNLTPGVAVAGKVLALVDRDRDGVISTNETAAYIELLKRDLSVHLDGRDLELRATRSYCPNSAELRTGWAYIQVEYSAKTGVLKPGLHKLTIINRHLSGVSAYLLNATQPSSPVVEVTRQTRTENQSAGEIEFTVRVRDEAKPATEPRPRDRAAAP